jgi:hypothetical protein
MIILLCSAGGLPSLLGLLTSFYLTKMNASVNNYKAFSVRTNHTMRCSIFALSSLYLRSISCEFRRYRDGVSHKRGASHMCSFSDKSGDCGQIECKEQIRREAQGRRKARPLRSLSARPPQRFSVTFSLMIPPLPVASEKAAPFRA